MTIKGSKEPADVGQLSSDDLEWVARGVAHYCKQLDDAGAKEEELGRLEESVKSVKARTLSGSGASSWSRFWAIRTAMA